jgi:hypothetical protein
MAHITCIGPHAQRFVTRHTQARVAAVFARSLHLEASNDFLCIGDASIGRGPLNAVVERREWARLGTVMPALGTRLTSVATGIRPPESSIRQPLSHGGPPRWPPAIELGHLASALDRLKRSLANAPGGWPRERHWRS